MGNILNTTSAEQNTRKEKGEEGGEKVNGKIIILGLLVFMLLVAFAPVLAAKPAYQTFTLKITGATDDLTNAKSWTDGGISHIQGIIRTATATFTMSDGTKKIGSVYAEVDVMKNLDNGNMTNHYHKWNINFADGSFVGTLIWTQDGTKPPILIEGHAVLQGTGVYEDQTMKVETSAIVPPSLTWYGTIMVR